MISKYIKLKAISVSYIYIIISWILFVCIYIMKSIYIADVWELIKHTANSLNVYESDQAAH